VAENWYIEIVDEPSPPLPKPQPGLRSLFATDAEPDEE